jgi:NAD(P)H-flavin reductase|tara:strand:- start:67 stop:318 length:252 start_codon:yes stop_codon:yes gene_type:complete
VALELFEALEAYCKGKGLRNFELNLRLSKEKVNPRRWDEKFVLEEMGKFNPKEVNRVWICGPPVMDETFERAFATADFGRLAY